MQAIILAAGMGRRLRYETTEKPKCLVDVNGRTMLERSLEILSKFPLSRIVLVIGYRGDLIRRLVGERFHGIPIVYIENKEYATTNNIFSLYLAKDLLGAEDTLLLESDLVYEGKIIRNLINSPHPNVVVVDKYKPYMDGTVIKISPECEVTAVIPKAHFDYREIGSYYKTVNIYKFSKDFSEHFYIPFLEAYATVLGKNKYYEQVLRVILTLDQNNLRAMLLDGEKWYESDTLPDVRDTEIIFAEDAGRKLQLCNKRYGGYWRFEGLLDFCYLVNPFFRPQRMLEEYKLRLEDLLWNYPSGQEVQCLLAGDLMDCREDYLAVGNGAAEFITSLAKVLPGRIGVRYPTFMEYPARMDRDTLVPIATNGKLNYTAQDLFAALEMTDTLLVINPDNPSGNFIERSELLELVRLAGIKGKRVVVDESFVDFAVDGGPHTLIDDAILESNPHLVVIRSISKTFGVPGVRLGLFASADKDLVSKMRREMSIWNINSFAEYFLQIAAKYRDEYNASCVAMAETRTRFSDALSQISFLEPMPSQANYVLCRLSCGWKSGRLAEHLLQKNNIYIKSFDNREGLSDGEYVRLAVRLPEENDTLIQALIAAEEVEFLERGSV